MVDENPQGVKPADVVKIEHFEGVGDLTIGTGSNWVILITALCLLDHPQVNKFFLAQKLRLTDRITKTNVFPREGMALPNGEVYEEPKDKLEEK